MTKFINEKNLTEAAKIIKQYIDESGSDIDASKIVNSTSPNARYSISNTDDGIVADYDSSRSEDGVIIVGGGTHNSFEITDTGVKLRASQTRVVAGGVTGYDNSIEIGEDGVMVNGKQIATLEDALTTQETQTLINSILYPGPAHTSVSYFTFDNGTLTGFSAEGQAAYDAGELTDIVPPSSYSLGELVTEEVTYTELFELDEYCRENGYNFTFVNSEGETVAITSEEEFFDNYETLMTLWEENQSITVTMQVQKFVDGTDVDVTSLGDSCFIGCTSLTSITIPEGVTSLGNDCFLNCPALTSITLPNSVTSIGSSCFNRCASLTSITIPNSVISIGTNCFQSCTSLTSITIPNNVTSLGGGCFQDCTSLTSITLPNSVTSLDNYFFYGCTALTSITIPNSVTSLGQRCFNRCMSLTSITLPANVTSLGYMCFYNCSALTSITVQSSNCTIGTNVFDGTNNCPIYVPAEALEAYKIATNWSTYANRLQATMV